MEVNSKFRSIGLVLIVGFFTFRDEFIRCLNDELEKMMSNNMQLIIYDIQNLGYPFTLCY